MSFKRRIGESLEPEEHPADFVENGKWIEEYKERMAILLPKIQKAKDAIFSKAAELWGISPDLVIEEARKRFKNRYILEDNELIQRIEKSLERYNKPAGYLEQANRIADAILADPKISIRPLDDDFHEILNTLLCVKQENKTQSTRAENKAMSMTELEVMNTIRQEFPENDEINDLYHEWEKPWGYANYIRSEAQRRAIPEELLDIQGIQDKDAKRQQEVGKKVIEGGQKGAKIAKATSEKERRKRDVNKRYKELMQERHKLPETEVKKQLAKEFRVHISTIYRYLKDL